MARKGILGRKVGMTQVFGKNGELIPVTVVDVTPNVVLQKKTKENDGYNAVQLGYADKRKVLSNKPEQGHVAKAKTAPKRFIREIRNADLGKLKVADKVSADIFKKGDVVDVTGITKGHGYQGVIKKDNQHRGPEAHGSRYHRRPGSLGPIINRVVKGMKLPGRMGNNRVTMQHLTVIDADVKDNALVISGSVPGANKSFLMIRSTARK
ncbi:50S ribosomal protein L3 [Acetilactobacillus jinshanensis]|uniref:Large ribosomal subunit protein uL3 n=1 Tax=Acetilactobacillus jinshanensis TaxID=1720083 RepID=A0A4P6ZJV8_9LACO|nr:50S ribosomal protein L3 [Acetilactobacillus jinshanensis]QBP17823.1 50S ribosomal protein L3 [Acetilactobacillus jinshanensis]URL60685.1 50S ribosomal protein L3 [uncultured bacterium]